MGVQPSLPRPRSQLWKIPSSPGVAAVLQGYGGIICPVLIGFDLVGVITLALADRQPPLGPAGFAFLTLSAVLLVFAMQYSMAGLQYAVPPSAYLDWQPEASIDEGHRERVRNRQAEDVGLLDKYESRARACYDGGLFAFLLALFLLLIPAAASRGSLIPAGIVGVAALVEAVWIVSSAINRPVPVLTPNYSPPVVSQLEGAALRAWEKLGRD